MKAGSYLDFIVFKLLKTFDNNAHTHTHTHTHTHRGGVWVQLLEDEEARARVILVLRECIWNASAVSLVLPHFRKAVKK